MNPHQNKKRESPCKACEKHPCNEPKGCVQRLAYVAGFEGEDQMKAVDTAGAEFRFIPM